MKFASIRDLKINASEVIKKVEEDEDIIVTKRGKPVALMVQVSEDEVTELIRFIRSIKFQRSLHKIWKHSEEHGLDKMTDEDIEEEIRSARKG